MADDNARAYMRALKDSGVPKEQAIEMLTRWQAEREAPSAEGSPAPFADGVRRPMAGPLAPRAEGYDADLTEGQAAIAGLIDGLAPGATRIAARSQQDIRPPTQRANPFMPIVGKDLEHEADAAEGAAVAQRERAREAHPVSYGLPNALGAIGSPLGAVGGAIGSLGSGLGVLGRLSASTASGAATGAAEAASEKRDAGDIATAAGVGGLLGGGVQGLLEIGRLGGRLSPWVKRAEKHADAGTLPPGAIPEKGETAIQKGAEGALGKIRARQGEIDAVEQGAYREAVEPRLFTPADPAPVRKGLLELSVDTRTSTGKSVNPHVQKQVKGTLEAIGHAPMVDDVLKTRRAIGRRAGFASPAPTPQQLADQEVYGALNTGLKDAAPEVAAADARYAGHKVRRARESDILGFDPENGPREIRKPPRPEEVADADIDELRVRDENTAIRNIKRHGDENIPGVEYQRHLDELAAMDPEFKKALDYIEAVKAREATRFSLNNQVKVNFTGGLRGAAMNLAEQNLRALGATAGRAARAAPPYIGALSPGALRPLDPFLFPALQDPNERNPR